MRSKYFYQTALNLGRNLREVKKTLKVGLSIEVIFGVSQEQKNSKKNVQIKSELIFFRFDWDEEASTILGDYPLFLGAAHGLEIPFISSDYSSLVRFTQDL